MKTLSILFLTFGLLTITASSASAQNKIATIDLRKVFDDYFKTKTADAALKERASDLDKERKALLDQYEASTAEYKKALDDANNQAVSTDEREKRKKAAEGRLLEIKELEGNIQQFDRQARATLEEQQRRMRENILGEIKTTITSLAKLRGFSLVLDTAAETANRTPVIIFSNGENDITDSILVQLNAAAPPGALTLPDKK